MGEIDWSRFVSLARASLSIAFAGAMVLCMAFGQVVRGNDFGITVYAHIGSAVVCACVVFAVFGLGVVSAQMCTVRRVAFAGTASLVLYAAQMAAILMEGEPNIMLQIIAGVFGGVTAATCVILGIAALLSDGAPSWPAALFAAFVLSCALTAFSLVSDWAFLGMAVFCGGVVFSLHAATPPVKLLSLERSAQRIAEQRSVVARILLSAFLLDLVLGYSLHHFANYSIDTPGVRSMLVSAIAGLAVVFAYLEWSYRLGSRHAVSGFPVLKALPIAMVFAFVPLQYFTGFLPFNVQIISIFATGAILVPLFMLLAVECSRALRCKPLSFVLLVLGASVLGLFAGAVVNVLVGLDTASIAWAIAPVICLIAGIVVCNFTMSRSAIAKDVARAFDCEAPESPFEGDGKAFKSTCMLLAGDCGLTAREVDVLYMLVQGYSVTRVAEALHIAEGTATTHKRHIYQKLDVHSKNELIDKVKDYSADR